MGDRGYFIYIYISSWNDLLIRPLEFGQFTTLQNMGVKIINFFYVFGLRWVNMYNYIKFYLYDCSALFIGLIF